MKEHRQIRLAVLGAIALAAVVWFASAGIAPTAQAQDDGGGGGFGGGAQRPRMGMGMMGGASMCVMGSNLYVLRGNTLYKFTAELEVAKKYTFEDVPPGGGAPGKKPAEGEGEGR